MKKQSSRRKSPQNSQEPTLGAVATHGATQLRSFQIGALPLLNDFFARLKLRELLREHLPPDDPRQEIATEQLILLLVANVLICREPLYGVPDWATRYAPEMFHLTPSEALSLTDDRLGTCLQRLYTATTPKLILAVIRRAIQEFNVSLNELHNDSTSISFHGDYLAAERPVMIDSRLQPAITWGHSKDHRPDLKQLLFTLTLSSDGGVPVYFSVDSGNTTDDTTHRLTWDLLQELVGHADFLYVADCKLASRENLLHIAARGGRFITVLPATRREDSEFRGKLREIPSRIAWRTCWIREEEQDGQLADTSLQTRKSSEPQVVDIIRSCEQEFTSSDGFRVLWFHSQRKAQQDELTRVNNSQRVIQELEELQRRLALPRTRFHRREQVEQAVNEILTNRACNSLLTVDIIESERETFHQQGRGRPTENTPYRREITHCFQLRWQVNDAAWKTARAGDGVFPLLTNDRAMTPREVLEAYKRQPQIEKRFSQLKSDYGVAPVFLKNPRRVLGLFTVYFLALLVQSLLERALRQALAKARKDSGNKQHGTLEIYPEGRRSHRPTARRALDVLESIRRHIMVDEAGSATTFFEELTPAQRHILVLLNQQANSYGL